MRTAVALANFQIITGLPGIWIEWTKSLMRSPGRHWVAGDIEFMDEAADQLALGSNRFTGTLDRVDEIAYEMTEV